MRILSRGAIVLAIALGCYGLALADLDQGFETDISSWDVFGGTFDATRVASGTNGVTSADGSWHAHTDTAAGNWGGYNCVAGCASTDCAMGATFPPGGWTTSVDIWLDVSAGYANNTRFDFSSAASMPDGTHRRDFIFNGGFYNDADGSPGSGTDRFIVSASNNSQPGSAFAKNPDKDPIALTATDWYTFAHTFYDSGGGVLAVDMTIHNSSGTLINTWTLSDPTDIVDSTVAGNRYGWFDFNEIPDLPFDNTSLVGCPPPPQVPMGSMWSRVALGVGLLAILAVLVGWTARRRTV